MATGPCDACSPSRPIDKAPDYHSLVMTPCGRALCRGCDCEGNCYDRHIPSCAPCIKISNREVAREMTTEAVKSRNLLFVWRKTATT